VDSMVVLVKASVQVDRSGCCLGVQQDAFYLKTIPREPAFQGDKHVETPSHGGWLCKTNEAPNRDLVSRPRMQ